MTSTYLNLIFILASLAISAQVKVSLDQTYIENDTIYSYALEKPFTGHILLKRRNNHLVYEEIYDNGIMSKSIEYFNGKEKKVFLKTYYRRQGFLIKMKDTMFHKSKDWFSVRSYDEDGIKYLVEEFEYQKLIYSCEYSGKKKNGIEYCYNNEGEPLTFKYNNGKKVKE